MTKKMLTNNTEKESIPAELARLLAPYLAPLPSIPSSPVLSHTISTAGIKKLSAHLDISVCETMRYCLGCHIWPLRFVRNRGVYTATQQATLLAKHVVIIGCGGLGGHVITLLARHGIGHLSCCDGDVFDESNLNRQVLCTEQRIGMNKALAAQEELARIASHIHVNIFTDMVSPQNLPSLLSHADVLADCLDSLTTRHMVAQIANSMDIPFVHAALTGLEGFTMVCPASQSNLEQLYPQENAHNQQVCSSSMPTCTPAGLAVLQTQLIITTLLSPPTSPSTQHSLFHLDLSRFCIDTFTL